MEGFLEEIRPRHILLRITEYTINTWEVRDAELVFFFRSYRDFLVV